MPRRNAVNITKRPQVTLYVLLDYAGRYTRNVMRGVAHYRSPNRILKVVIGTPDEKGDFLRSVEGAVISMFTSPESEQRAAKLNYPLVNVSDMSEACILPRVVPDHRAVGRLAADHLVSKGLRRFAFGGQLSRLMNLRHEGFATRLAELGFECERMELSMNVPENKRGLAKLPTPVGILAGNDHYARKVIEACAEMGRTVPADVAVIGVDDDEVPCMIVRPFLSSIDTDGERVGFEAARLIDHLLDGMHPPQSPILTPPRGIVERESTDVFAIDDPNFVLAARFIRDHACEGIKAKDVAVACHIPARSLRDKFRRHLNTTLRTEILRVQLEVVKRLLRESNLTIDDIASRCGFQHYGRFNTLFNKASGIPPGSYRRRFHLPSASIRNRPPHECRRSPTPSRGRPRRVPDRADQ